MTLALAEVIASIESNDNPGAIRFEPATFAKVGGAYGPTPLSAHEIIGHIKLYNHCDDATARVIYATSWGAFQDMGFTLYGPLRCQNSIAALLGSPALQATLFDEYCRLNGIGFPVDEMIDDSADAQAKRLKFARAYNGPGNVVAYAQRIFDTIQHMTQAAIAA
jgi:hypothetical protein